MRKSYHAKITLVNFKLKPKFQNTLAKIVRIFNCQHVDQFLSVYLAIDDIEQPSLLLTSEDLFDNFKFSTSREIDKNFLKIPEEYPAVKITRLCDALLEYKKTTGYQVFSFFNRHPIISSAGIILGSAAVGVAVGLPSETVKKTMGYTN